MIDKACKKCRFFILERSVDEKKSTSKRRVRKSETIREQTSSSRDTKVTPKKGLIRRSLRVIFSPLKFLDKPLRWLGRHLIPRYFRSAYAELKFVTWPDAKQSRQLTTAVILFAIVFGIFITIVDYGLDKVFKKVFLK